MERILDRVPNLHPGNLNWPVRAALPARPIIDRYKMWRWHNPLDQLAEGACVGFGITHELLASPVPVNLERVKVDVPRDPTQFARFLYNRAKMIDEWEGIDYEGTSVRAGFLASSVIGLIKEFRWAFGLQDVKDTILVKGPVVFGINWYSGMYEAPRGVLRVTGDLVGGHCLIGVGRDSHDGQRGTILQNSWGPDWGNNGLAWISDHDLDRLLHEQGEACVPTRRSYGRS